MTDPKQSEELGEQALEDVSGGARRRRGTASTAPTVRLSPSPGGPTPIPYPNTGMGSDAPKDKIKIKVRKP